MEVIGAGCVDVNGKYSRVHAEAWKLGVFHLRKNPRTREWIIVHQDEPSARYAVRSDDNLPPKHGWHVCRRGVSPAPREIRAIECTHTSPVLAAPLMSIVGNGNVANKGSEIDRSDTVVRFNHGVFHDASASPDIGSKTSTWVFTDASWRKYKQRAIEFVHANPDVELVCFNPLHPNYTSRIRDECPRPFKLLTLDEIRCRSCHRFRTWHHSHCCLECERGNGHGDACLSKRPTTGLRYLIDERRSVKLYGFDAFKTGHYGNRFPLSTDSLSVHDVACEARIVRMITEENTRKRVIYAGIYSDKYEGEYKALHAQLIEKGVHDCEIMFQKVPQALFESRPNCFWCRRACRFAFHHGETCKIDYQLELYKRFLDRDVLIVFVDADVELHSEIPDWNEKLEGRDIAFEQEGNAPSKRWVANINLGFTLCKSTYKIIQFYENVLDMLRRCEPPLNWDQQVVNYICKEQSPLTVKLLKSGAGTGFAHCRAGGGTKSNLKKVELCNTVPKNIAIVGSEDVILCGSEIERADVVVRIGIKDNNVDARHIGNRTDVCVQSVDDALSYFKDVPIRASLFGINNGLTQQHLNDVRICVGRSILRIPIAEDCYSTRALGNMRFSSTPFDWIVVSPRTVLNLFRSDFDGFLHDVVFHRHNTRRHFIKNAWDGSETMQGTVEFWDKKHKILVPHHMSCMSQLPNLRAKMQARIDRMYADMEIADAIEFWYKPTSDKELMALPDRSDFGEKAMRQVEYELVQHICTRFGKRGSDVKVLYV